MLWPLVLAALLASACTDDEVVTIHTGLEPEAEEAELDDDAFEALDTDGDGVVARDVEDVESAAQRAEREAQRAEQDAAYQELLADSTAVAASLPGGQLLVSDVQASIVGSPITLMDDPQNPTHEEFVSRLTSMVQLRLAGLALDGFGFAVDIGASDEEINAQVQAHLEGPFEEFAQQRSIEEDPSIERLATPHCVSVLAVSSEAALLAAVARVEAGELLAEVAADVNLAGLADADGSVGCGQPIDLFGGGELSLALLDLSVGEISEPSMLPSAASETGELWVVLHLDSLDTDAADLSSIGPFAGRLLTEVMSGYEVSVAPALGEWSADSLRVSMPQLP